MLHHVELREFTVQALVEALVHHDIALGVFVLKNIFRRYALRLSE
jgi:hypothetical protein